MNPFVRGPCLLENLVEFLPLKGLLCRLKVGPRSAKDYTSQIRILEYLRVERPANTLLILELVYSGEAGDGRGIDFALDRLG